MKWASLYKVRYTSDLKLSRDISCPGGNGYLSGDSSQKVKKKDGFNHKQVYGLNYTQLYLLGVKSWKLG